MRRKVIFFLVGLSSMVKAQKTDTLRLNLVCNSVPVELGVSFWCPELKDSVRINKLLTYLSLPYTSNSKAKKEYKLVDFASLKSCRLLYKKSSQPLQLDIGVDSLTNLQTNFSNDLDPIHGMYWTWQNGFIHFKLEGSFLPMNSIEKQFQFHLGGYSFPNNSVQHLEIVNPGSTSGLELNIYPLIAYIRQLGKLDLLSPGAEANEGMKIVQSCFSVKP